MTELNEQIKKVRESIDLFEKIQNSRTVADLTVGKLKQIIREVIWETVPMTHIQYETPQLYEPSKNNDIWC